MVEVAARAGEREQCVAQPVEEVEVRADAREGERPARRRRPARLHDGRDDRPFNRERARRRQVREQREADDEVADERERNQHLPRQPRRGARVGLSVRERESVRSGRENDEPVPSREGDGGDDSQTIP